MPIVQIEMLEGRNMEQKRKMVKKVTDVLAETLNCNPGNVHIIIREIKRENLAKNGVLFSDNK